MSYTMFVLDGDFRDWDDPETGFLRFDNLDRTEMFFLATLAFQQGFQVVIQAEGGADSGEKFS